MPPDCPLIGIQLPFQLHAGAQQLYEELGELALVQQMMRKQGSLYLAALVCASLADAITERVASARLTLALRHYERALKPQLLAQGAASAVMQRCAAEARLELANFFLSWADSATAHAVGTEATAGRVRHLETALGHVRAAFQVPAAATAASSEAPKDEAAAEAAAAARRQARTSLPAEVAEGLANAEQTTLRELIKAHTAQGTTSRAAALKEAYRRLLSELKQP